jgi:heterodisulfide reductase subunit B
MQNDETFADRVNRYMAQDKNPKAEYHGETQVLHYLELLRDVVGFDNLKAAVKNPLTGKKIAAYYGCLLLRPGKVMAFDDVENPKIMEDFIRAIGAEPVIYPARNECCGGYIALEDAAAAKKRSNAVSASAANHGAEMIVTACPLCKYNLVKNGSELPVVYITELLAEALGVKEVADGE